VVIHYEEALYQVHAPLPLPLPDLAKNFRETRMLTRDLFAVASLLVTVNFSHATKR